MRRHHAIGLALLTAILFAIPAAARADVMYWGGTIKGDVYGLAGEAPTSSAVLGRFEADAGKEITFVNTGQSWAGFNTTTMEAAIEAGVIPLVTMGLPAGVTLKEVAEGKQDAAIRRWATAAREFGYPFLFRPWWEQNGGWYSWGRSPDYVAAWRHFHDLVLAEGATNVTWAWVVNAVWSDPASNPAPYYPGDAYVDWVGMDAYNWGRNPLQPDRWLTAEESIQPTLEVLEGIAPGKPVCVCENASTEVGEGRPGEEKALWIEEMLDEYLPSRPQIKAYLWFNWNVEQGGYGSGGGIWDWQIESSPDAEEAFRAGIQGKTFLSVLPPLTPLTKVPMPAWPPSPRPPDPGSPASDPGSPASDPGSPPSDPGSPSSSDGGRDASQPATASGAIGFAGRRAGAFPGSPILTLSVPGPGELRLSGRGLRIRVLPSRRLALTPFSRWIEDGGELELELRAAGRKRRALEGTGRVSLAVTARFTPLEGRTEKETAGVRVTAGG